MFRWKTLRLMTVSLLLALTLSACAAKSDRHLVYVEGTDVTPMDPHFVTDTPTQSLFSLLYNNLVRFKDETLEVVPDLATEWTVSEDQLTWTFKLREGVKFHDGTPFHAEAAQFNLERILDEKTASPFRANYSIVAKVAAVDPATLAITTKTPFPDLPLLLAQGPGAIISPTAAKKVSNPKDYGKNPVGTGPFKLEEWLPGERTVLVANPDYFGTKPWLEKITYKPVPEPSTRVAMLKNGEADIVVKVPLEEMEGLSKVDGVKAVSLPSMFTISMELLTDKPPLNDVRVRQALNHAIDKEAIIKNVLLGQGRVNDSPVSPGLDFRKSFTPYPYDPAKAKALLQEAGAAGFKLTLWGPNARYQKDRQVTEAVAGYLEAVGIDVELKIWEWAPYLEAMKSPDRMAFMVGRASPGMDYTATRLFATESKGVYNLSHFSHARVDSLLKQGRSTFDKGERAALYGEMLEIIWNEAPYIYLHNQVQTYGMRSNVEGMVALPQEVVYLGNVQKK